MDKQYLIEGIEKMSEGNKDIYIQLLKILVLEGDNLPAIIEKVAKVTEKTQDEVKVTFEIKEIPSNKLNADNKEKKRSECKNENITIYEILERLVSEKEGYISDIMSLYKPELIVELRTSDYISINTEEDNKDTWSITETGKKCYKLYKELTDKEQERGKLLHDLSV